MAQCGQFRVPTTRICQHDTVRDIDAEHWQRLVRLEDIGVTYGYLQLRESLSEAEVCLLTASETGAELAGAVYANVVTDAARSFARPAVQLISPDCLRLAGDPDSGALDTLARRWAHATSSAGDSLGALRSAFASLLYPSLVVFTPIETRFTVEPSLPAECQRALAADLLGALHDAAEERGCRSIIVFGTSATDTVLLELLRGRGYVRSLIGAAASIPLDGMATLDDYFAFLPWKRRSHCRKELRRFLDGGFDVREISLAEWGDAVARLELAVLHKHGSDRTLPWLQAMKSQEAEHLSDAMRVLGGFLEGELVASVTYYASQRRHTAGTYGCDYERTNGTFAYYALGYYLPIAHAIERGARELCLGFEAYQAKLHRGARLDPRLVHVWTPDERGRRFASELLGEIDRRNQRYFGALV